VYDFIVEYIGQYGVSPTRDQIKCACDISSNNVVDHWLDKLEYDGRIIRHRGRAHTIHLPPDLAPPPIQPELPLG
jgi:SOS-response transcriptional repressor LexA